MGSCLVLNQTTGPSNTILPTLPVALQGFGSGNSLPYPEMSKIKPRTLDMQRTRSATKPQSLPSQSIWKMINRFGSGTGNPKLQFQFSLETPWRTLGQSYLSA